jgi:anti-sigma B factor antagonist
MATQDEVDVRTRRTGETAVVTVVGAIDVASAESLDQAVMGALQEGPASLTIDLRRANHFDSSGVRVLVRAMRYSRTAGVGLALCLSERSPVRKVLELSGVAGAIPVVSEC